MAKISELLFQADNGQLTMPDFQRGWVWKKQHVKKFFNSLYRDYPVGSLIVCPIKSNDGRPLDSVIDGKQRLSTLYAVIRGKQPPWLTDHDVTAWDLHFNLQSEEFDVASKERMEDPLWVSVKRVCDDTQWWHEQLDTLDWDSTERALYSQRISKLASLCSKEIVVFRLPEMIDVASAVDVFSIVNRAGTRVSEGDLILGQISLEWHEARETIEKRLGLWRDSGFEVPLEWLLHAMSADLSGYESIEYDSVIKTGRAELEDCYKRVAQATEELQNLLRDQLGFDQSQTTKFNMGLVPIVSAHLRNGVDMTVEAARPYLGWWLLGTLWRRWSADVKTRVNADLRVVSEDEGVEGLMRELRSRSEGLKLAPAHFEVKRSPSQGALRLMRIMTRRCGARSLCSGLGLSFEHVGDLAGLQMHHIFPRALLGKLEVPKKQIDQVANLAFIRQGENLKIGAKAPVDYLPEYEDKNPGVLASQWIPQERSLWRPNRYQDFLEARRRLLAEAANSFLEDLLGRPLTEF
ncbi:MAG: DUF262 domain-containing protein [Acidimicrobiaceae bacterium]|nr:DUF262 domain-containing protein [Acidimicrobiaceae bacterium]MCY4281058.1 DUF262 domain-containing protein [Acidimicrobiaceae bacterium]MCY4294324.1 DUF262 domain-containing protein [Acidimicrobiaceae bacterium]